MGIEPGSLELKSSTLPNELKRYPTSAVLVVVLINPNHYKCNEYPRDFYQLKRTLTGFLSSVMEILRISFNCNRPMLRKRLIKFGWIGKIESKKDLKTPQCIICFLDHLGDSCDMLLPNPLIWRLRFRKKTKKQPKPLFSGHSFLFCIRCKS